MGSGGSFSIVHDELISGGDISVNSTIFLGQDGRHDVGFYELAGNHVSDQHSDPITNSLPSDGAESHYQTSTRKYQLILT